MVEQDRVELLQRAVDVLRSVQSGNHKELTESLAGVVGFAYLLGIQMGISPRQVDSVIDDEFRNAMPAEDKRESALREVIQHLSDYHL